MTALKKEKMKKQNTPQPQIPTPLDGPTPEETLMRELDEAMRQEKLKALWDKYANWAIGGVIAIVAFVAVQSVSTGWMDGRNEAATAQLAALQAGQDVSIDDLPSGQATLARLMRLPGATMEEQRILAAALAEKGDDPAARQLGQLLSIRLSDDLAEERLNALDELIAETPSYYAATAALDAAAIAIEGLNDPARATEYLNTAEANANGEQNTLQLVERMRVLVLASGGQGE